MSCLEVCPKETSNLVPTQSIINLKTKCCCCCWSWWWWWSWWCWWWCCCCWWWWCCWLRTSFWLTPLISSPWFLPISHQQKLPKSCHQSISIAWANPLELNPQRYKPLSSRTSPMQLPHPWVGFPKNMVGYKVGIAGIVESRGGLLVGKLVGRWWWKTPRYKTITYISQNWDHFPK